MRTYTIREVSKRLGVNPETVRRWVRDGALRSVITSKKEGYVIEQCDLDAFLDKHPKYFGRAARNNVSLQDAFAGIRETIQEELFMLRNRREAIDARIIELEQMLKRFEV